MSDGNEQVGRSGLSVGIAEVDITPEIGRRMAGMPGCPRATGVHFPLFGRIMVLEEGQQRVAIVSLDLLGVDSSVVAELRDAIAAPTLLAAEDVFLACSHTHRAPFTAPFMDTPIDFGYVDLLKARLATAADLAWNERRPARLLAGKVDAPGWTFNRRPVYRTDHGEQVGTQGPHWGDDFVRVEGPADSKLHVVLVEGLDGRLLGGLVNYACHTTTMGHEPVYSADFAGPLTEALSRHYGGIFLYLQGASANLWALDNSTERFARQPGPALSEEMGRALAIKAQEAITAGWTVSGDALNVDHAVLRIAQRRPTTEQLALARSYLEDPATEIDQRDLTLRIYGHDFTFYSNSAATQEWFAREAIGMWEWQWRTGQREPSELLEVQAIAVGDLAIVGFPVELFTEFGLDVKARSPFRDTIVVGLANGWHGYVPTREAFAHGGYEPRLGQQSRLAPDAGERLCDAAIHVLHRLTEASARKGAVKGRSDHAQVELVS